MWLTTAALETLSDYAGFFGSCIAIIPALCSSWVYVSSRMLLKKAAKFPGSVFEEEVRIAELALEKASHFTQLDVSCLGIGFALLIVSFLLKIL